VCAAAREAVYTASWAVEIAGGGEKTADIIAARRDFTNLGQVSGLDGVYHFELSGREKQNLQSDSPFMAKTNDLLSEPLVVLAEQQVLKPRALKSYTPPEDPLFPEQWNLANTGQLGRRYKGNDLRVEQAWMQGLTGCNVTVAVADFGIDYHHKDLRDNYAPDVSYDFVDNDEDPFNDHYNHGTKCSGIIASAQENKTCGVGIAYKSNLGGIRLLTDEGSTDIREAEALSHARETVDIYNNGWGVLDTGRDVDGPGTLTRRAINDGVSKGRNGKGSMFVFANGNGGSSDDCAADGYASSVYTISVGAIGVDGNPSVYDEQCSAKMVVSYVTNKNGADAVVSFCHHHNVNWQVIIIHRQLQTQETSVRQHLVEQVQQLQWYLEQLHWLLRQSR
jgi:proprotein convertase subtilisin/kexin type 2